MASVIVFPRCDAGRKAGVRVSKMCWPCCRSEEILAVDHGGQAHKGVAVEEDLEEKTKKSNTEQTNKLKSTRK